MNTAKLNPLLRQTRPAFNTTWSRSYYYKFKRTRVPPLQEPKESPYIVGPYLKPSYVATRYITDPIKHRYVDDFDNIIYEPTKIETDESRRVKLLLIDDVEGLGTAGQVVDAPYRFGSSKLIAMKKAEYHTEFAEKWYKFGPRTAQSASSALSPRTVRFLTNKIFTLPVAKSTDVQPWHISLALRLAGCFCPIDAIDKDSIKEYFDENDVQHLKCTVVINNHERPEVRFCYGKEEKSVNEADDSQ